MEQAPGDKAKHAILCLHGAGSGGREFRPLMSRCPKGCRLVVLDLPGHGRSQDLAADGQFTVESCAETVGKLVRQLEIVKPILLGCGFGAAVAIRYAADHAEEVPGVVLCLPAGLAPAPTADPFSQPGKRAIHRLLSRMKRFTPGKIGDLAGIAACHQALRMAALQPAMQSMRAAGQNSVDRSAASLRKALDSLSCPALFALSRHSREYPLQKYMEFLDPSPAFAQLYPFTVFAGAFHPIWDEPQRFAVALSSFVQAQLPVENHTHAWLLSAVDWPAPETNLWKCVHPDCQTERVLPTGQDANQGA